MANPIFTGAGDNAATTVQGFAGLQRALRKIGDGTDLELRRRIRDVGARVALVAAGNAPRDTGELQHSIKVSVTQGSASVYSNAVYGGAINFGAGPKLGWQHRGPHITRARASHYMDRAVTETAPWVQQEMDKVLDWVESTFEEG